MATRGKEGQWKEERRKENEKGNGKRNRDGTVAYKHVSSCAFYGRPVGESVGGGGKHSVSISFPTTGQKAAVFPPKEEGLILLLVWNCGGFTWQTFFLSFYLSSPTPKSEQLHPCFEPACATPFCRANCAEKLATSQLRSLSSSPSSPSPHSPHMVSPRPRTQPRSVVASLEPRTPPCHLLFLLRLPFYNVSWTNPLGWWFIG